MILIQISVYKKSEENHHPEYPSQKLPHPPEKFPIFIRFFLVFRKANQGTPARICTKTFPTLIGRNPLVVVLEQVRFKRDVN